MKTLASELAYFFRGRARRNLKLLAVYIAFLTSLILIYAWLFDVLMLRLEGRRFSFISGIYWTVTAMTTLGFGDITFESDGGRLFSALVTLSGVVFLLVFLPFALISFFIAPWIEDRLRYRPPSQVRENLRGHVVIAGWDPLSRALVGRLRLRGIPYTVLEAGYDQAVRLNEGGVEVVHGIPTDASTLRNANAALARIIVANLGDTANVNLVLTARSLGPIPVLALLDDPGRLEYMELSGASHIIALKDVLGRQLAVRATTRGAFAHVVDSYDQLLFAEIPAHGGPFVGKTVMQTGIREQTGVSLVGLWERGRMIPARPEAVVADHSILVFAGTREQLEAMEALSGGGPGDDLILILGYGTVGRSAARFLEENEVAHRMVDLDPPPNPPPGVVSGNACDRGVLGRAGIAQASGAIVTTNDDGTNVFLTLVARHLNPDLRIVARANREENVPELYAAGADLVVSLVSVGTTMLMNVLEGKETTFLTEGMTIFWRPVPTNLVGKTVAGSQLRPRLGVTVVGVRRSPTSPLVPAEPGTVLEAGAALLLVGTPEAEEAFSRLAGADGSRRGSRRAAERPAGAASRR